MFDIVFLVLMAICDPVRPIGSIELRSIKITICFYLLVIIPFHKSLVRHRQKYSSKIRGIPK